MRDCVGARTVSGKGATPEDDVSALRRLRRVRWFATLVGSLSGVLFGAGLEALLVQGGRFDPWLLGYGPLIGIGLGGLAGYLHVPQAALRVMRVSLSIVAATSMVLAAAGPATAQETCTLRVWIDEQPRSLDGVSQSDPIVVDVSDAVDVEFAASAPGTSGGAFQLSVVSAEAGLYAPGEGDQVVFYGPVSGDAAFGSIVARPGGLTGFEAEFEGREAALLPYGTLELEAVLFTVDAGVADPVCTEAIWVRVVASPLSNPFGRMALGATLLGLIGLGRAGSLGPVREPRRTGEPPGSMPPSEGPFLPTVGPHVDAVQTELVGPDGESLDPAEPLIAGREYRVRLTLRPGALDGSVQVSTGAGQLADAHTITIDAADGATADFPLQGLEPGSRTVSMDITAHGHLVHTERVSATVVADTPATAADPATAESLLSLGDLSIDEIKMKPARSLLVILESDPEDRSVDVRVRDTEGVQLVEFDSPLQPAAISAAADRARTALRDALDAGPGRRASIDPALASGTLIDLATAGRSLHKALFPSKRVRSGDPAAVGRAVRDGVIVQIVQNKSGLGYTTLPWSLVYDRPFTPRRSSAVCPTYRGHGVDACPNADDTTMACPTGFWGYRALLEEPWLDVGAGVNPSPARVPVSGSVSVAYLNDQLTGSSLQFDALEAVGAVQIADLTELLDAFNERAEEIDFIYFYSHHTTGSLAGASIEIAGEELSTLTFDAVTSEWARKPVVMINACGSGDYSLTDSMSLVEAFRHHGSAGLITTECELWDPFAGQLALRMITAMMEGETMGAVLLDLRRDLIGHGNPVGFAYRLHALADTRIRLGGDRR